MSSPGESKLASRHPQALYAVDEHEVASGVRGPDRCADLASAVAPCGTFDYSRVREASSTFRALPPCLALVAALTQEPVHAIADRVGEAQRRRRTRFTQPPARDDVERARPAGVSPPVDESNPLPSIARTVDFIGE